MFKSFCNIYAQFDQVRDRLPQEAEHLLRLGLICDSALSFEQLEKYPDTVIKLQQAGGITAPTIYPPSLDSTLTDPNWWRYPEEECLRLLNIAKDKYEKLGIGALTAINTYTPGNSLVAACRKAGIKFILGFCAPTVIEDGAWHIAHYGSPLTPYFISDEDFRKPENPGQRTDAVMMISMEMRNPMVCLSHWSEGPWCPLNALAADRTLESGPLPLPYMSIARDWINQGKLSEKTMFFQLNLQYFFNDKCYDHNHEVLQWLAECQNCAEIEVASATKWRELCLNSEGLVPQTSYWRGEMPGYHTGNRPGIYPDVIVDESLRGQSIWCAPDLLPKRFYDYQKPWKYPAFIPDCSAPTSVDFSAITTTISQQETEYAIKTTVKISNSGTSTKARLMLWNALGCGKGKFEISGTAEWNFTAILHPAGTGGAVMAEGVVEGGESELSVTVNFQMKGKSSSKKWGNLLAAETFLLKGKVFTVIAAQTPEPFSIKLRINPEACIDSAKSSVDNYQYECLCGRDYSCGEITSEFQEIHFDGTRLVCWCRIWGATVEQLDITGVEEIENALRDKTSQILKNIDKDIAVPAPGYQVFGPLTDDSRWEITVGRLYGIKEKDETDKWFREQRPDAGKTVIEAHPGIYLPKGGSITKTLGHKFDDVRCQSGYELEDSCADYPQAWDWGVGGWVQWRHLNICLKGLNDSSKYTLHLQAIDPEFRNTILRIHAYKPHSDKGLQICLCNEWVLPKGTAARRSPKSLISVEIPKICQEWGEIMLWINPLEKSRMYDWIKEKGCPGVISHLWVTKD